VRDEATRRVRRGIDHVAAVVGAEELFWAAVAVLVALLTGAMAVRAWRDI